LFDSAGTLASLRARAVTGDGKPAKSLAPTGYQTKGLVFACPLARNVLKGGDIRWWDPQAFVISEGEIDFLTWASRHAEATSAGPAYLGISAGSWTQTLADQIPDGARIFVRTDRDAAGHRYAMQIADSLEDRCTVLVPDQEGSL
jgi:Toprim-like